MKAFVAVKDLMSIIGEGPCQVIGGRRNGVLPMEKGKQKAVSCFNTRGCQMLLLTQSASCKDWRGRGVLDAR